MTKYKFLTIFLLIFLCGVSANAADLSFSKSSVSVTQTDQSISFDIQTTSVTDLKVFSVTLSYDATKIEFVSASAGSMVSSASPSIFNSTGSNSVEISGTILSSQVTGSGAVFSVSFKSLAADATSSISMTSATFRDKDNATISVNLGSALSITKVKQLLGDFNDDKKLDINDIIALTFAWNGSQPQTDIAPVSGSQAPYWSDQATPDNAWNIQDLIVFTFNWTWCQDYPYSSNPDLWGTDTSTTGSAPSAPSFSTSSTTDADGSYTISWGSVSDATSYTLEEDENSSFSSPTTSYSGSSTSKSISGKSDGTFYYRVKATNSYGSSSYSSSITITVDSSSNSQTLVWDSGQWDNNIWQ